MKTQNLYVVGNRLYNYNTAIAYRFGNRVLINTERYSQTTSKIQNKLIAEARYGTHYIIPDEYTFEVACSYLDRRGANDDLFDLLEEYTELLQETGRKAKELQDSNLEKLGNWLAANY